MDKELAKEKIAKWLESIPKSERDIPYFKIPRREGSQLVSPQKAVEKLSKEQKALNYIAEKITDQINPDTETKLIPEDIDDLVMAQLMARLENMPPEFKERFKSTSTNGASSIDNEYSNMINKTEIGKKDFELYKQVYLDLISKLGG